MQNLLVLKDFLLSAHLNFGETLRKAIAVDGPAVLAIPVDYRDNDKLMKHINYNLII